MSAQPDAGGPAGGRNPLSLRARMALLVGVAVAAAIFVVALAALIATRTALRASTSDQVVKQAAEAARYPVRGSDGPQIRTFGQRAQLLGADGSVGLPQDDPTAVPLPVDAADIAVARGTRTQHVREVRVDGEHLLVATVPTQFGAALQWARPLADVDRAVHDLFLVLIVTGVLGVGGAVVLGLGVAKAGLRPVDEAAKAAEHVAETQDLSALIPVRGNDEVARLAGSLNLMLRALDSARQRQRQLVDDASHELRTPLTSLRTNVELLLLAESQPGRLAAADRTALLRDVDGQMREMSGLITELVQLARDEAVPEDAVPLDLADIVHAALDRVRPRAGAASVTIVEDVRASPLWGRPHMLERAVINLLDNAVKFSPPGGEVTVTTTDGVVTVADRGPGIDPADRPLVFGRFYRSSAARGLPGSGLGLAIVADAAREHGGSVQIGEAAGGGAAIRLMLPRIPPEDTTTAERSAWAAPDTSAAAPAPAWTPRAGPPLPGPAGSARPPVLLPDEPVLVPGNGDRPVEELGDPPQT